MLASSRIVANTAIPSLARVVQNIPDDALADIPASCARAFTDSGLHTRVSPGMRVAVGVGSRGIDNIALLTQCVVNWFKEQGAIPFLVPAMGSHGQATPEGQAKLLAGYGITEAAMQCPIRTSLDVFKLGELENGLPVYLAQDAAQADGIFVINRVKPHTNFRGPIESGLVKMLTIGLGKQLGANSCHQYGFAHMHEHVPAMAKITLGKANVLGGLAVIENAYDHTFHVEVVPGERFLTREPELLSIAWGKMPLLPLERLDVLVVEELGKNISGSGMDPNVTGRFYLPSIKGGCSITKIVVLDITDKSHGNALGMGCANYITHRFRDKIDFETVYANALTTGETMGAHMPVALANDRDAIKAALKTCFAPRSDDIRMARIKNTLEISSFEVTENLLDTVRAANCTVVRPPQPLQFTDDGELADRGRW